MQPKKMFHSTQNNVHDIFHSFQKYVSKCFWKIFIQCQKNVCVILKKLFHTIQENDCGIKQYILNTYQMFCNLKKIVHGIYNKSSMRVKKCSMCIRQIVKMYFQKNVQPIFKTMFNVYLRNVQHVFENRRKKTTK